MRTWTSRDIVEVRRVTTLAIAPDAHRGAFVLKQARVDSGVEQYALYTMDLPTGGARRLLEASYLSDVQWDVHCFCWSVLANLGKGVQLYDVTEGGRVTELLVNDEVALIGAFDGWLPRADEAARPTGVFSYQWAPDGHALWYARVRLKSASEQQSLADHGLVYDDATMNAHVFRREMAAVSAIELHLWNPRPSQDHLIAAVPSVGISDLVWFRAEFGTAMWSSDSKLIRYSTPSPRSTAQTMPDDIWTADGYSGVAEQVHAPDGLDWSDLTPVDADELLTMGGQPGHRKLLEVSVRRHHQQELGEVDFRRLGLGVNAWPTGPRQWLLAVHWNDRDGLTTFPHSPAGRALAKIQDSLSHCVMTAGAGAGLCVRESQTLPPEIVMVSGMRGTVRTVVRPNADYDQIEPLRLRKAEWPNRYGNVGDGYVMQPRGYDPGKRYPTVLITHGRDADNHFADPGFQWEFPAQVFAERGYLVILANEPRASTKTQAAQDAFLGVRPKVDVEQQQFSHGFDAVAGMEAALQSVIDSGEADPQRTGIAGYSRGSEVVELVMSHSKMFKVGSDGDAGGWNAGVYWAFGSLEYRHIYESLYGGSPYDPRYLENYRRYSPSMRAGEFAGPLLQQFSAANGPMGLELHSLLQAQGIPTELVFFPQEAHIFWQPRHRLNAMDRNLQWFDYWLLDKKDTEPGLGAQYSRWASMAAHWRETAARPAASSQ